MSRPIVAKVSTDPKTKGGKANSKSAAPTPELATAGTTSSDPSLTGAPQGLNANGEDTALSAAAATSAAKRPASPGAAQSNLLTILREDGHRNRPGRVKKTVRIVGRPRAMARLSAPSS